MNVHARNLEKSDVFSRFLACTPKDEERQACTPKYEERQACTSILLGSPSLILYERPFTCRARRFWRTPAVHAGFWRTPAVHARNLENARRARQESRERRRALACVGVHWRAPAAVTIMSGWCRRKHEAARPKNGTLFPNQPPTSYH